jgi:hypothetical protein
VSSEVRTLVVEPAAVAVLLLAAGAALARRAPRPLGDMIGMAVGGAMAGGVLAALSAGLAGSVWLATVPPDDQEFAGGLVFVVLAACAGAALGSGALIGWATRSHRAAVAWTLLAAGVALASLVGLVTLAFIR